MRFDILNVGSALGTIGSVLVAILVLLFMVTVHEAGHYFAGKAFGFKINEFAIGMGPAIFKKKMKNGEVFSVRILPLGGFCQFEGEDEENSGESDPGAFNNKKPWQRIIVLLAGATMNFLSAIFILILATGIYGQSSFRAFETMPAVTETANSLQTDDILVKVNGRNIYNVADLSSALNGKKANDLVDVEVLRGSGSETHINAGDCEHKTVQVRLLCDPTSESIQDYGNALKSLGIATIFGISDSTNTDFTKLLKGDYFLRITSERPELFDAEYIGKDGYTDLVVFDENNVKQLRAVNEKKYLAETRAFSLADLRTELKKYNDGDTVYFYISRAAEENKSERILLKYKLDGFTDAVKSSDAAIDEYLGIKSVAENYRINSVGVRYGFFETIGRGIVSAFNTAGVTFKALGQLLTGKLGLDAIGGPITTITVTSTYVAYGFEYLLQMAGLIGVSLAAFNILPIPALDGARAVFVVIEWIRGKPINRKVEGTIHAVGLIALLLFAVAVDLLKFI